MCAYATSGAPRSYMQMDVAAGPSCSPLSSCCTLISVDRVLVAFHDLYMQAEQRGRVCSGLIGRLKRLDRGGAAGPTDSDRHPTVMMTDRDFTGPCATGWQGSELLQEEDLALCNDCL